MKTNKQGSCELVCNTEKIRNMPDLMTLIESTEFDPAVCAESDCQECNGTGIGIRSGLPCDCVQKFVAHQIISSLQEEFNWIFEN